MQSGEDCTGLRWLSCPCLPRGEPPEPGLCLKEVECMMGAGQLHRQGTERGRSSLTCSLPSKRGDDL